MHQWGGGPRIPAPGFPRDDRPGAELADCSDRVDRGCRVELLVPQHPIEWSTDGVGRGRELVDSKRPAPPWKGRTEDGRAGPPHPVETRANTGCPAGDPDFAPPPRYQTTRSAIGGSTPCLHREGRLAPARGLNGHQSHCRPTGFDRAAGRYDVGRQLRATPQRRSGLSALPALLGFLLQHKSATVRSPLRCHRVRIC